MQYTVVGAEAITADPNLRPDLVFETVDGFITVGTISDSEWSGFCHAVERPNLLVDARFNTPAARSVNAVARITLMGEVIKERSSAEWLGRFDAADVPCAPILRRGEIIQNEQVVDRRLITELDQPTVGRVRQPRPAARFESSDGVAIRPAPRIGEHTKDILVDLGYSDSQIANMAQDNAIKISSAL